MRLHRQDFYNEPWIRDDGMHHNGYASVFSSLLWFLLAIIVCGFLGSCATKTKIEYVDREVVKYKTKVEHDTLINNIHDSIYHTIFQKGDTIYNTKYVEHTLWRDKVVVKIDTCYRDSLQTITKETTIEKKVIPKWCYFSLVICGLFIIFAIYKITKWLH